MAQIETRVISTGQTRYRVRWREGGRGGSRHSLTFEDRREAERIQHLIAAYGHLPPQVLAPVAPAIPSFESAAAAHLAQLIGVEPHTVVTYRRMLRTHFDCLLALPVSSIDREAVVAQMRAWEAAGASSKTIANRRGLLSAVMTTCIRRGWVTANPCAGVRLPRHTEHEQVDMTFLTPDEFAHLLAYVPARWQPLVQLLADSGARWGEIAALDVADVDTRAGRIKITKAVKRDEHGHDYIGPPKTKRSRRTVSISPGTLDLLRPLLRGRDRTDRLFVNGFGRPVRQIAFYKDVWHPARVRAMQDLDEHEQPLMPNRPRVHDLRHSCASWLIAAGVDLFVIQHRLGHESIKITMDRYGHLMPNAEAGAVDAMQAVLSHVNARTPAPLSTVPQSA